MRLDDIFKWEQDCAGGDHGTATFFSGSWRSVTVPMYSFKDAFALQQAIQGELDKVYHLGRSSILNEVACIPP